MTPVLPEDASIEEIRNFFTGDRFAMHAGCSIVEGRKGHSVIELDLKDFHRNALQGVQGGAIFTLADFALAVACNVGSGPTVSVSHTIDFYSASKGTKLIAEAICDKDGKRLAFYTVNVVDDLGKPIAKMTAVLAHV